VVVLDAGERAVHLNMVLRFMAWLVLRSGFRGTLPAFRWMDYGFSIFSVHLAYRIFCAALPRRVPRFSAQRCVSVAGTPFPLSVIPLPAGLYLLLYAAIQPPRYRLYNITPYLHTLARCTVLVRFCYRVR
jgi:hypothetical protein